MYGKIEFLYTSSFISFGGQTLVIFRGGPFNMSVARVRTGGLEGEDIQAGSKGIKPERNLLAAVLARAICDAFGSAQCDRHVVRSARQWLFGKLTPTRAFSFAWVAQHLDLDPVSLQLSLRNYETDPEMLQERLSLLR